jgi:hypothetical protein
MQLRMIPRSRPTPADDSYVEVEQVKEAEANVEKELKDLRARHERFKRETRASEFANLFMEGLVMGKERAVAREERKARKKIDTELKKEREERKEAEQKLEQEIVQEHQSALENEAAREEERDKEEERKEKKAA